MHAHGLQASHDLKNALYQTQSLTKINIKNKYTEQSLKGTGE